MYPASPKQGTEGLTRLEIERTVLDLDEHVVVELPVERLELVIGLRDAVGRVRFRVHERPPQHDATVRLHGSGERVRALGVSLIVLEARVGPPSWP